MGLDAYVACNCFEEGKTTPPPYREYVRREDAFLILDLPWEENKEKHEEFERWSYYACPHHDLMYHERIGNMTGYRLFQSAVFQRGQETFPTLMRELPEFNGGSTTAQHAREMLKELEHFNSLEEVGTQIRLVDSDTNNTIWIAAEPRSEGQWVFRPGRHSYGIDRRGFYITIDGVGKKTGTVFRSRQFKCLQNETRLESIGARAGLWVSRVITSLRNRLTKSTVRPRARIEIEPLVEFIALDSGLRFRCRIFPLHYSLDEVEDGEKCVYVYPQRAHIEEQFVSPSEFQYATDALISICKASIETGNPIYWG